MIAEAIIKWRERTTPSEHRPHLGASVIGHECSRHLWLHFRWAKVPVWDGRVLRMFDTGKREESRVLDELRGIGAQVWADDGTAQFRVSALGGHFGGSMDAVIQLPTDTEPCVLEIKTHNAKSFADLKKSGVAKSKPQHWTQMQVYMHLAELNKALYFAVNKDTDEIYTEDVAYDWAAAERIINKAQHILTATEPPSKISEDPSWFACKWCSYYDFCHGTELPDVNCRTCCHSTAIIDAEDAKWTCGAGGNAEHISVEQQRAGCNRHLYLPALLKHVAEPVDGGNNYIIYRLPDGGEFINGPAPNFSSKEIQVAQDDLRMLDDTLVKQLKIEVKTASLVAVTAFDDMESDDLDAVAVKPEVPVVARKKVKK